MHRKCMQAASNMLNKELRNKFSRIDLASHWSNTASESFGEHKYNNCPHSTALTTVFSWAGVVKNFRQHALERQGQNYRQNCSPTVSTVTGTEGEVVEILKVRRVFILSLCENRVKGCGEKMLHGDYRFI